MTMMTIRMLITYDESEMLMMMMMMMVVMMMVICYVDGNESLPIFKDNVS